MENAALVQHSAAALLKEKLFLLSDSYKAPVCDHCGHIGPGNKLQCRSCKTGTMKMIAIPYACKLLFQELMAMNIAPRIRLEQTVG